MNCRQLRYCPSESVFHICNRGALKATIFRDEHDYAICEKILLESVEKYGVRLYAYCLMPNHWHLLVEAENGALLVRMLQRFTSVHAKALRRRHQTEGEGAVYQSRFRAHPVQKNEAMTRVTTYIENNPVVAGLATQAIDWMWSSAHPKAKTRVPLTPNPVRQSPQQNGTSKDKDHNYWTTEIEVALSLQTPVGDLKWIQNRTRSIPPSDNYHPPDT